MNFVDVSFKNFLSYGNKLTTVELNNNKTNLFFGLNGHGKSTVIEAIYFALTGKPFRKIVKNKLINNINNKNCYVKLVVERNGAEYVIERGIKPNIFKISVDGKDLDESASTLDFQKILEMKLGFDSTVLKQTIFLSSGFFQPFMKMDKAAKRSFVEYVLSIGVFSDLNKIIKKDFSLHKEAIKDAEHALELLRSELRMVENTNAVTTANAKKNEDDRRYRVKRSLAEIQKNIDDLKADIKRHLESIEAIKKEQEQNSVEAIQKQITDTEDLISEKQVQIENLDTEKLQYIKSIDEHQKNIGELSEDMDNVKVSIDNTNEKLNEINDRIKDVKEKIKAVTVTVDKEKTLNSELVKIKTKIEAINANNAFFADNESCPTCQQSIEIDHKQSIINKNQELIDGYESQIEKINGYLAIVNKAKDKLKSLNDTLNNTIQVKNDIQLKLSDLGGIESNVNTHLSNHKTRMLEDADRIKHIESKVSVIYEEIDNLNAKIETLNNHVVADNNNDVAINHLNESIKLAEQKIAEATDKYNETLKEDVEHEIDVVLLPTEDHQQKIDVAQDEIKLMHEKTEQFNVALKVIGDNGIRTYIIKKYLPLLNQKINEYLDILGAPYQIMLDEEFNEQITMGLDYGGFSAGEKQRADLSTMFAFLDLAAIKNNVDCNCIFLDECLDTNIDSDGVNGIITILNNMVFKGKTIFAVTHKKELASAFNVIYNVKKTKFSSFTIS